MHDRTGISRREFVRCAAAGAASMYLTGCTALSRRGERAKRPATSRPELTDRDTFRRLADAALDASEAEHTLVLLTDAKDAAARFRNNAIAQLVDTRRRELTVTVAFGQQVGFSSATGFSDSAVVAAVWQAETLAKDAPPDTEYVPPLPPQRYPVLATWRPETAAAGPARCEAEAVEAIGLCRAANLRATGNVATNVSTVGLAASTGLFAYERRTRARFELTAAGPDSVGWAANANRSIDDLGFFERTRLAIDEAKRSVPRRELPAGSYTAILAPPAVATLLGPLLEATDARAYHAGTSALRGALGQPVVDQRLTLRNRPDHPALLGDGFDDCGLPSDARVWIERGVLRRLYHDRLAASRHEVKPSFFPDAVHVAGDESALPSVDDLIQTARRAALVTNLADVRCVNPDDLVLTAATHGGTLLVEDGQVVAGLTNLRWEDSPLRVFNAILAFTTPTDALAANGSKMFVPAMTIGDARFSALSHS